MKFLASIPAGRYLRCMKPATTCLICNAPLLPHQARLGRLCGNPVCQWKQVHLPKFQSCAVCGRLLAPRQYTSRICDDQDCQSTFLMEQRRSQQILQRQADRLIAEAIHDDALTLREKGAAAAGIREPETYP